MSVNTATLIGGPALVQYRGASFYSKGDITLEHEKETFDVAADRFGKVDERVANEVLRVRFTPSGEWENLAVLWPYASTLLGSLLSPTSLTVSSINTTTDELTVTAHGLATGDDVLVHVAVGGTLPTSTPTLTTTTRYYVRNVSTDVVKLYPTSADASADTNAINFTAAGTGTLYLDRDYPLVVHAFDGTKLTFYNAAITKMPSLVLSSVQTLIGEIEFEVFLRNGSAWSDAAARYAISTAALSDTSFDPADILTQPYTAAWGASAPWSSFESKAGFNVDFNLGLEPVVTDALGIVSRRLASLEVTCRAQPMGPSQSDLMTKLLLQDTGATRGRSLSSDNLLISGTGVYVQLYGAALKQAGQNYSQAGDRLGELLWVATRTFSVGVPNNLFYVGATSP